MTYESHIKLCYDCHTLHIETVNPKYFNGGRDGECVLCRVSLKNETYQQRPFRRCPPHPNCSVMICSQCLENNWQHADVLINTNLFNSDCVQLVV